MTEQELFERMARVGLETFRLCVYVYFLTDFIPWLVSQDFSIPVIAGSSDDKAKEP